MDVGLDHLGVDAEELDRLYSRFGGEAPEAGEIMRQALALARVGAMTAPDTLYEQTLDMRRSHLGMLLEALRLAHGAIIGALGESELRTRVRDGDAFADVVAAMEETGDQLLRFVDELTPTRE
jgi:hypothetical protein